MATPAGLQTQCLSWCAALARWNTLTTLGLGLLPCPSGAHVGWQDATQRRFLHCCRHSGPTRLNSACMKATAPLRGAQEEGGSSTHPYSMVILLLSQGKRGGKPRHPARTTASTAQAVFPNATSEYQHTLQQAPRIARTLLFTSPRPSCSSGR